MPLIIDISLDNNANCGYYGNSSGTSYIGDSIVTQCSLLSTQENA